MCDCDAKSDVSGSHHWRFCLLWSPPDPNVHPDWCKCQRICGGDQ